MSGGKGKKTSSTSQTSSVAVPGYLNTELQNGVSEARRLYDQGAPEFFPGQTVAGFAPDQLAAMQAARDRATNGSPLVEDASQLAQRTINGEFLNNNPFLDDMLARYGAKANSQVLSQFNKAGRLGSGSNVATAAQAISDATLPALFQNYQNERGLQQGAAAMAPGLAAEDYKDIAALNSVGDTIQGQNQREINGERERYEFNAMADSNWLDQYLNRINSSGANNLTTTQTNGTTTEKSGGGLASTLGSALALGSMFVPGGAFAGLGASMGGGLSSFLGGLGTSGGLGSMGGLSSTGLTGVGSPIKSFAFA